MKRQAIFLTWLMLCLISIDVFAQPEGDDPVSLVTNTTDNMLSKVNENFEEYQANPIALQTLISRT